MSRASNNRTITLAEQEIARLRARLLVVDQPVSASGCDDRTIFGDALNVMCHLPKNCTDLLIVDPPYNLTKEYDKSTFKRRTTLEYEEWLRSWMSLTVPLLKPTASIYVCSEWRSSSAVERVLDEYFVIRNRITWEREKGRGALHNWKNCSEDIWFCTMSDEYYFDVDAVKQRRRVVAPYRNANGRPKDWTEEPGGNFRLTHPSNLWTDISVPFWSMRENTEHPTQKPEKLIAKLILASSRPNDRVFDPFLGSGTTSVVAKKLRRHFIGIEHEETYCLLAEKRLEMADDDYAIQGYSGDCFWDRNTLAHQGLEKVRPSRSDTAQPQLFEGVP